METLETASMELLQSAPLNSWIALSADQKRIVAVGDDPQDVLDKAAALGEEGIVLAKTPPTWAAVFAL
jgi:hypothetical protein